jgi:type IV pilus assembly protein PilE
MERYYAANNAYANGTVTLPSRITSLSTYTLSVTAQTAAFTVTAAPLTPDAACGTLSLTNTGSKGASGASGASAIAACWK